MEGDVGGYAGREATQGRFEESSSESSSEIAQVAATHIAPSLTTVRPVLPTRLMRLAALPWFECWTGQLRAEKKSTHTIRAYTVAARGFSMTALPDEDEIDWTEAQTIPVRIFHERADPSFGRIDAWIHGLGEMKPATINARIAAVSHLLKWLGHAIPEWVQRPARRRPLPRPLGRSEVLKVRTAALRMEDPLAHPIVTTMLDTGLRVSELCNLDLDDVDHEDLSALVIGGKGEKDRTVLFTKATTEAIEAWNPIRSLRAKQIADDDSERALFLSSRGRRINPRSIQKLIDRLADEADIPRSRLSPHTLRHTFATGLLERGADLVTIQRLLGHASIATTRVYLEISDQTLREIYHRVQRLPELEAFEVDSAVEGELESEYIEAPTPTIRQN